MSDRPAAIEHRDLPNRVCVLRQIREHKRKAGNSDMLVDSVRCGANRFWGVW